jgi:D-threonate/D-erythronate kinase
VKFLALADDATGALETGARLVEAGLEARVRFEPGFDSGVIDTETRHLPAELAGERIREIAALARKAGVVSIFKKTDSTLRGNIAAEFRALLDVWPELRIVYAPAYPALGRTVRNGELFVNGWPLRETAFANDPLNPAPDGSIRALLGDLNDRVDLWDGEIDQHLADAAAAAAACQSPCIVAGTAAMASAWAACFAGGAPRTRRPVPVIESCLVVNGSLHPASREQLAVSGMVTVAHSVDEDPEAVGMTLATLVAIEGWAALCASETRSADPLAVAAHAARAVAHACCMAEPDCLMVFGGDTVFAILRELGITEAVPHAEILPGVPASTIAGPRLLVTKAGGFGGPDALARLRSILVGEAQ